MQIVELVEDDNFSMRSNVIPETIVMHYMFENDVEIICTANFEDDCFRYVFNGEEFEVDDQEFVFCYSTCAQYFKDILGINERYTGTKVRILCTTEENKAMEYISYYGSSSIEDEMPEFYSGVSIYRDNVLVALNNNIFLYDIYCMEDIRERFLSMIE